MAKFAHHDLRLLNPSFDSPLVDVIAELEHLRRPVLSVTTPGFIFFQLKDIFHKLESVGSARIEGNHTTLADYVESQLEGGSATDDQFLEIENIEHVMSAIDEQLSAGVAISASMIREWHSMTVQRLRREGDKTPGAFRKTDVAIAGSDHQPPPPSAVSGYVEELVDFINREDKAKYDLMKVALAHHRFGWIHPFSNGNGRVVRLLTYALLIKYGFNVGALGRLLNPSAVFCIDRERYYEMLSLADKGSDEALEDWCGYVLGGILQELRKLDQLANYDFLQSHILAPALAYARARRHVTEEEFLVLQATMRAEDGAIRSRDLKGVLAGMNDQQRTYRIGKMLERNLLMPTKQGGRQYTLCFASSELIRGVIRALVEQGFVPELVREPTKSH